MLNIYISNNIEYWREKLRFLDQKVKCYENFDLSINYNLGICDSIDDLIKLKDINNKCILIFIIDNYEQIFEYQKFNIHYYLRKNFFEKDIEKIKNSLIALLKNKNKVIKYKSGLIEYEINIDNILYIESYRNEIIIHTKLPDYSRRFSLKKILKEIDNRFVQCHKSYLVNIENVTSLFYDHLEINNIIKIPVGRKYQLLVKNKYQNYQNRNF